MSFFRVEVADNGIGIPQKAISNIFDEFVRAHKNGHRGRGLGLSIVARVIANHGGSISVESVEGDGSLFVIELPKKAA